MTIRQITDDERVACTLLALAPIEHLLLALSVRAIVIDPACTLTPREFAALPADDWLPAARAHYSSPVSDTPVDDDTLRAHIADIRDSGLAIAYDGMLLYPALMSDVTRAQREMEQAAADLAGAVVEHRLRPGDTTHDIGHGLSITTSLAAAICTYHDAVCRAYYKLGQEGSR